MRHGLALQLAISLRLHFRNKVGLLYSYLFPTIFLVAFWVLYGSVGLPGHMGELLTVTALGGACFGLPTSLVNERERGVWRRYRLAPVPTQQLIASMLLSRYLLLLLAGALQVALARALGVPFPGQPLHLFVAYTLVCFGFLGLGLVIAMLADNVPAVQALGQCIFLPMLIIGGIAVRLERLPEWAQHLSAFFPGRYAVEAIQASFTRQGIAATPFAPIALVLIGGAGIVAGGKLFRWEPQQRFALRGGWVWVWVAVGAWAVVGAMAEFTGVLERTGLASTATRDGGDVLLSSVVRPGALRPREESPLAVSTDSVSLREPPPSASGDTPAAPRDPVTPAMGGASPPQRAASAAPSPAAPWEGVTAADIERDISFERIATSFPDEDVVAPVATGNDALYPELTSQLQCIRSLLPSWGPAHAADPVQRVRNHLYLAAVPDILQLETERWMPIIVFERLQRQVPREQLVKILYWIAIHPGEGDDSAVDQLRAVCMDVSRPRDTGELRDRTAIYAIKLLGRLTGKLQQR